MGPLFFLRIPRELRMYSFSPTISLILSLVVIFFHLANNCVPYMLVVLWRAGEGRKARIFGAFRHLAKHFFTYMLSFSSCSNPVRWVIYFPPLQIKTPNLVRNSAGVRRRICCRVGISIWASLMQTSHSLFGKALPCKTDSLHPALSGY